MWGEIGSEKITFNEETLWSGGPAEGRDYNGGNVEAKGEHGKALRELNAEFADGRTTVSNPNRLTGGFDGAAQGAYMNWGDLLISSPQLADATTYLYERSLDLNTGVAAVHFNQRGTDFMREYFVSNPDNVMALHFSSKGDEALSFDVSMPLNPGYTRTDEQVVVDGDRLVSSGALGSNGLRYNAQIRAIVEGEGATVSANGDALSVSGAKGVTLFVAAGTDYKQEYPAYRTGETPADLNTRLAKVVDAAVNKGYEAVKRDHIADHQGLYDRVSLDLGQAASYGADALATNELLDKFKAGNASAAEQRTLETMVYNYGRYLTIASSRENSQLPSNLQGIWSSTAANNAHTTTPWGSDFHMNVNLQMNYWPTYSSNLSASALPLIEYAEGLVSPGRVTADVYAGAKTPANTPIGEGEGYMAHTENTAYGWTTPGAAFSWGWSPAAMPWLLQNVYEYYEYTGDKAMLQDRIYPLLKEEANFYVNYMLHKGNRPAGDGEPRLTTGVAYSPEHGPMGTDGNTYESSLVWQLLDDAQEAATTLGVDADLVGGDGSCTVDNWQKDAAGAFTNEGANRSWDCAKSLLKPIEIGKDGQIKEWFFEGKLGQDDAGNAIAGYQRHHRYLSHMLGLFPGDLITVDNAEFLDAAKVSLNDRGDDATGWGVGQRINSWARTGDGDRSLVLIQKQLKNAIYPNLFDAHPPFQIDGNFGNTSGVNEMLMQSNSTFANGSDTYANYIHLLPALPSAWASGSVDGLKARGDFDLAFAWDGGKVTSATITSNDGGKAVLAFDGANKFKSVKISEGEADAANAAVEVIDDTHIAFDTVPGASYELSTEEFTEPTVKPSEPTESQTDKPTVKPSEPTQTPTEEPTVNPTDEPTEPTVQPSEPGELTVVTPAEPSFINPSASDPASCTVQPYATVEEADGVIYTVTVDGKELTANEDGKFVYPYGKTIKVTAAPDEGFKFSEGAQTEWSWTAMLNDKCDPQPTKAPTTQPTTTPAQPGKPGGLAKTGVDVGTLVALAAALGLAGASVLVLRRRSN